MRLSRIYLAVPVVFGGLVLGSCGKAESKRAAVAPPMRAGAPELVAPPAPKIEEKAPAKADPVDALIARVEKEYNEGQANYAAGHLEAAKTSFDRAFNLLLQNEFDVRGDERLSELFERMVEGINNLELLALQQGDGFTEQRAEPAPIDEAMAVTFPVDPNIKAMAAEQVKTTVSDIPLVINDLVASYINFFSSRGKGTLQHGYMRAGRYREMISRTFAEEGVPQDLIYLAQAESGFKPVAVSRAGARGMWQFMASRASGYGLKRNWWMDERQDPEKATRAAARHLRDLYHQFGDWYLAMAAYNSGPGTVQRAVQRTGYADFWELYRRGVLPAETRNYVPIILAITIMSKNPAQYGLENVTPEPPLRYDTVKIDYPIDLRLVAEAVDASVSTLQELNPSLLRLTTPKDSDFDLRVPAGTAEQFQTAVAAVPRDMRVWWRYHRVAPSDTLETVARRYRTTPEAIAKANDLDQDAGPLAKAKLIIPVTPGKSVDSDRLAFARRATRYKVRKGDTVMSVADDFGVPVESLRRWNRLKGNTLRVGRTLTIHKPLAAGDEPLVYATKKSSKKSARAGKSRSAKKAASAKKSRKTVTVSKSRSKSKGKATARRGKRRPQG